jgi:hypothetical protein
VATGVVAQADVAILRSEAQRRARRVERIVLVALELEALLGCQPTELDDLHRPIQSERRLP